VLDAVVAGHDRPHLGALLFLTAAGAADPAAAREQIRAGLAAYDAANSSSSRRIARALVVDGALSLDEGETTDKGYTNQRRVLARRAGDVDRLFADPPGPDVITL
jgi:feruloyl-CoA synthase